MRKAPVFFRFLPVALIGLFIFAAFCARGFASDAKPFSDAYKRIIVLDPGHGGQDSGARGPNGVAEKSVTLSLARLIAAELGNDFNVALTRDDDYHVPLENRPALANNLKADIFISLHTGGSFIYSTTGAIVYHYNPVDVEKSISKENADPYEGDPTRPIEWDRVQIAYLGKSRSLARIVNTRFGSMDSIPQCRVQGAPAVVLQAAAMPAILIEAGYLTNPDEENKLNDTKYLINLAAEIARGIRDFLASLDQ